VSFVIEDRKRVRGFVSYLGIIWLLCGLLFSEQSFIKRSRIPMNLWYRGYCRIIPPNTHSNLAYMLIEVAEEDFISFEAVSS
jgi:hypothetical protein